MTLNELETKVINKIQPKIDEIDKQSYKNSEKVLNAFRECNINESHFNETTGYGYQDVGREAIEKIFSIILGAEDSLVRSQIISGSHALTITLFGLLRPNDILLSITGEPYDTLHEVIGIKNNPSSLKSFNIKYEEIDLINNDFDYSNIEKKLKEKYIKVIEIQRSKGYSTRKSLTIPKLEKVIKLIKKVSPNTIVMVDNCYCEFVEDKSPLEIGADIIVGSLIKNLGGGVAPNGGYISGKKELVNLCAERLTLPGEGKEVGPTLGINKLFLDGLFMASNAVANSLKTAIFTSAIFEELGYEVEPKWNDPRADIVQNIIFNDKNKLIQYCQGIQKFSPIDSNVTLLAGYMPGYSNDIVMASGSFVQGSTIDLSCDAPIRKPYIAYQQGGRTYEYGRIGVINAIESIIELK